MSHWLIPANTKFYDVFSALEKSEAFWPMNAKISCGDVIYIYLASPYKQIGFCAQVLETSIDMDDIIDHVRPFVKGDPGGDAGSKPFMKINAIKPVDIGDDSDLSLAHLKQNGLRGMLMGARKLENNPVLLSYINEHLS